MLLKKTISIVTFAWISLFLADKATAAVLDIVPASPKGQETIRLRVNTIVGSLPQRIAMSANRITVTLIEPLFNDLLPLGPVDVVLGQLPAGTYDVEALTRRTANTSTSSLGTTQFVVSDERIGRPANAPIFNWTDLWWNASESGWGINITIKNDQFFAAWFVYDAAGKPTWYTLQGGAWVNIGGCYQGPIMKTSASASGGVLGLSNVNTTNVGSGIVCFYGYDTAEFQYTVEGMFNTKQIVRQPF